MSRSEAALLKSISAIDLNSQDLACDSPKRSRRRQQIDVKCCETLDILPLPELSGVSVVKNGSERKLVFEFEGASSVTETREAFVQLIASIIDEALAIRGLRK